MWSQAVVQKYSGPAVDEHGHPIDMPASSVDASDGLIRFWLQAAEQGWGFRWAVLLVEQENRCVGHIGFNSLGECSELAYHLNPDYWGQGIMTEAALLALAWGKSEGATALEAYIEPGNTSSEALALRLGMHATDEYSEGARRFVCRL